jgi:hypothetical protein
MIACGRLGYQRSMRALPLFFAASLATGCITHLPPPPRMCHMRVHWAQDFAAAQARAQVENKPILACLVAGKIDGLC